MKKALVLALTTFMVLSLATAAFAVDVSYEGKVEVKWEGSSEKDGDPGFAAGDYEASVNIDLTKDFGDGVSAGANIKIDPTAKSKVEHKWNDDDEIYEEGEVASADAVKLDGAGWIKVERDLFALTAKTGIDGGVGKAFGEYPISEKAGLGLDLFLIDGLTINSIVNGGGEDGYNFLVKGEYAADLFSIGGGYQKDAAEEKTAFGVYGSADLIDGLTLNVEFGNRKEGDADAATAILASASYDGLLNATASFYTVKEAFGSIIDEADDFLARDKARFEPEYDFSVIFVDAAYNVTDALAIDGSFDYILNAKDGDDEVEYEDNLSYKVGASYTFDAFKVEGWYKAYVGNEVGGKATYNLADGVETSFEVTNSKADKDADNVLAYTLLISAAL